MSLQIHTWLKRMVQYPILVLALTFCHSVDAATIVFAKTETGKINPEAPWLLQGEIVKGDLAMVIATIKSTGILPYSMSLDSPGGDINEAIDIGLFLRRALIRYQSAEDGFGNALSAQCSSACALIFFGAVERQVNIHSQTSIGLHKPSFVSSYRERITTAQAEQQYKSAEKTLRLYLHEMSIPDEITDLMFRTEPEATRYFSDYRLAQWFPTQLTYDVWLESNCAGADHDESGVGSTSQSKSFDICQRDLERAARLTLLQELNCAKCRLN